MISCGGGIVLILLCGGLFMFCRTKKDKQQEQFIATPSPGYSDYTNSNKSFNKSRGDGPVYAKPNVNVPLIAHSDSEPNTASTTFSGAKMNDPEFIRLMEKLREGEGPPSENFYYDINDQCNRSQSITPSTIL